MKDQEVRIAVCSFCHQRRQVVGLPLSSESRHDRGICLKCAGQAARLLRGPTPTAEQPFTGLPEGFELLLNGQPVEDIQELSLTLRHPRHPRCEVTVAIEAPIMDELLAEAAGSDIVAIEIRLPSPVFAGEGEFVVRSVARPTEATPLSEASAGPRGPSPA